MPTCRVIFTAVLAFIIYIISYNPPVCAQSVTIVRRDTLSIADTARISRPDRTRSVSDDLLKSVIHPSPFSF